MRSCIEPDVRIQRMEEISRLQGMIFAVAGGFTIALRYNTAFTRTRMRTVLIRGEGVAARCCSHLLRRAGLAVRIERVDRPKLPAIMLGEATQRLLADVFQRADLFEGLPSIRKRVVRWGAGSAVRTLPHSAVVVSEQDLLSRLGEASLSEDEGNAADWTVLASRPLPASSVEHHF